MSIKSVCPFKVNSLVKYTCTIAISQTLMEAREAIKKRGLLMEIFHKGSDPPPSPPLFSGVMELVLHI